MAATPPSSQVEHPPVNRRASVTIMAVFVALAVGAVVFGGNLLNPASSTTDGDYAGETVEVLIPLAEGGGTDTWARFVGTELTRTIPGTPSFKPVNEAGGEGISGTNRFVASAKDDGTEVLVSTATTVVPWVLGRSEVTYDFDRLTPILANGTGGVIYGRTESGIKSPADLINRSDPLTFGGISATGLDLTTLVVFDHVVW
jgi:tripartite-type tricarboxylate transporter receptor subunit TctC